jgi:hypothetical protein
MDSSRPGNPDAQDSGQGRGDPSRPEDQLPPPVLAQHANSSSAQPRRSWNLAHFRHLSVSEDRLDSPVSFDGEIEWVVEAVPGTSNQRGPEREAGNEAMQAETSTDSVSPRHQGPMIVEGGEDFEASSANNLTSEGGTEASMTAEGVYICARPI